MRRLMVADRFKEVTRPVVRIWKEAKQSDESGNIYTETRRGRGFETVHVFKGIREQGAGNRTCQRHDAGARRVR